MPLTRLEPSGSLVAPLFVFGFESDVTPELAAWLARRPEPWMDVDHQGGGRDPRYVRLVGFACRFEDNAEHFIRDEEHLRRGFWAVRNDDLDLLEADYPTLFALVETNGTS